MISILRETHATPEAVARALELAGGINRFREPNYRAVWGWNRLAWIGGKFAERDPATGALLREVVELRQEPKYPAVNRWHIEKWLPPERCARPRPRGRAQRSGARAVSRARRIRALLYVGRPARRIRAAHTHGRGAHRPCDRMVAPPPALSREARPLRSRASPRARLRRLGLRPTRRRRPRISQTTLRNGRLKTKGR